MIYFLRSGDHIKIGYAERPTRRIATLRTANPNAIVVLGVMDGDRAREAELHGRFAHKRARGEWFDLCDEILWFIEGNCRPLFLGIRRIDVTPPERFAPLDSSVFWGIMAAVCFPISALVAWAQLFDRHIETQAGVLALATGLAMSAAILVGGPLLGAGVFAFNRLREWRYRRLVARLAA